MGTQLGYVKHFRDLEVYRKQRSLAKEVFALSKSFPREERFSLTDQLRRASRSIGAQIAEAWGKRIYPKHFVSKLTDADGEQLETQHWLTEAGDCGYLNPTDSHRLVASAKKSAGCWRDDAQSSVVCLKRLRASGRDAPLPGCG